MKHSSDEQLLEIHFGDATTDAREHVQSCVACAQRLRTLTRDLTRLDAVLSGPPPALHAPAAGMRWAPLAAAAAALLLGVAVQRFGFVSTLPVDDAQTVALLDELSNTMLDDATGTDGAGDDGTTTASTGSSTCTWGDPLLGVGCEEPAFTVIAWR